MSRSAPMTTKLLRRGSPQSDESFMGYITRLTELNGYQSPNIILNLAGSNGSSYVQVHWAYLSSKSPVLTRLSQLTGAPADELLALTYPAVDHQDRWKKRLVCGAPIPQVMIRLRYSKICLSCLRDSNHARKIWELAPFTACPIHNCLLIDVCPNCTRRISGIRNKVSVCECEYDWRAGRSAEVVRDETKLARQIYQLCGSLSEHGSTEVSEKISSPLPDLDLEHCALVLHFMAQQLYGNDDRQSRYLAYAHGNAELHRLFSQAFSVFEDWPTNFYNFLDWRRTQPNVVHTKVGVRRDFGQFEITLYKTLTSARFDFIRTAFEKYLVTRWDGGYLPQRCHRFLEADQLEQKYVSRIKAGRLLGMDYTKIEGLIKDGKLRGIVRNSGRRKIYLVETASIRAFKLDIEQRLSFKEATRLLGIHPGSLLGLVEHGCLVPLKRPTTGDRRWAFTRHSINDLLGQITAKVRPAGESLPADIYSFKKAAQKLRFLRVNLGQFVRSILDGEMQPCGTSAKHGLTQFNFSSGAIAAFIQTRLASSVGGPFSIRETATMLGLSMGAAYTLIKKGLLCVQQADTKSPRLKVTAASVTDFSSAYVSTRELSNRYDVAPRLLIRVLTAHGVRPTSGPQIDDVPLHLYRRTVLAHFDLATLLTHERHQINPIDKRGSLLNAAQVAAVLGINQEAVCILVRDEELRPYGRVPEDHEDKFLFTRYEVDHYRHRGIDRAELLTDVEAAQMLDEDPTWFYKRWVHTRRVSTVELVGSRAYYFLKQDIAALIEFKEKFITMTEAADMLGWNRATVHLWTQKGKLNPVSGPRVDNAGYYLYLKDDIENLRHHFAPVDEQR